jgi:hypothetical protein
MSFLLFVGALTALAILLAAACGGSTERTPGETSDAPDGVSDDAGPGAFATQDGVIRVYSSPT